MELFIDTTEHGVIKLWIRNNKVVIAKSEKKTAKISEGLVSGIQELLKRSKLKFRDLSQILVNPGPGGFSSTRTGVATANALNFCLGVDKLVLPKYDKTPNITRPKHTGTSNK